MTRILVIDDDDKLNALLTQYLATFDLSVSSRVTAQDGLRALQEDAYDVVVLDVMLPGMDGLTVLKRIRDFSRVPVVMLTARGGVADRIIGLEAGADDYLPKPFEPRELVARIQAVAQALREHDIRLGFHNHWAELRTLDDGQTFLDLLRELPAELLWLELDLGWIWQAGADPAEQLHCTAGRCPVVHLKDYPSREDREDVPIGDGVVGYDGLVSAAVGAGAEWLVVEEDEAGPDPFGAVERSLRAVRRMLAT
jgi:CheY-like chemotaxis protein